jgi:hypothetical protein
VIVAAAIRSTINAGIALSSICLQAGNYFQDQRGLNRQGWRADGGVLVSRSEVLLDLKRWLIALAALVAGGGVSAALLVAADPARSATDAYVAARDLPAGAVLSPDSIQLERVSIAGGTALLFMRGDEARLTTMRAGHDLAAGQLIQRSDVIAVNSFADRRLVFIPLGSVPAAAAGATVDLFLIGGTSDHPTVVPFAQGIEVDATVSGGLVVAVPARQAAAFVYAAAMLHLAAVVAEPGASGGVEVPVASVDDAMALAAGR